MIAIYIIAGIIFFSVTIYGIWAFFLYVREKYDYNIFNGWIITILAISFLIFLVLFLLYTPDGGKITKLDLFVSGGVACAAILGAFFLELEKHFFFSSISSKCIANSLCFNDSYNSNYCYYEHPRKIPKEKKKTEVKVQTMIYLLKSLKFYYFIQNSERRIL